MIVTALLSWYDEPLELLEDGIRSLRGYCDRIVAVDGAYEFTPGARIASPRRQADAICRAAAEAGLDATVHPGRIWAGQIEKRQYLFDLAIGSDWLLIHDADHQLDGWARGFRERLESLPDDVVTVEASYRTPPSSGRYITDWHESLTRMPFYTPLVFRCLPDLRVERHHWWYSGLLDDERVALWGWDLSGGDLEGANTLRPGRHVQTDTFWVTHRCWDRPEKTLARQRGLYAAREKLVAAAGVEP